MADITWVLGEELPPPRSIDLAEVTCHAGDDLSVKSLMDTLMMAIMSRGGYLRHHGVDRWDPKFGTTIHVFLDQRFAESRDHRMAIDRMLRNGKRYGMTLTIYQSYPTGGDQS